MKLEDFNYILPENLIAKYPAEKRDQSRLLVLNRKDGEIKHHKFVDIKKYFKSGDVLVVNNSKVFPARLLGNKDETGGKVELLLNREVESGIWEVIGRGLKENLRISFEKSNLTAVVLKHDENIYRVKFNISGTDFYNEIEKIGKIPLPPYIEKQRDDSDFNDKERYQTVYAKDFGSSAAPTAGLHFTPELLGEIKSLGVEILEVTLNVGLGTFLPIKVEDITTHKMHKEYFVAKKEAINNILQAKKEGRRIIAVGTTTTRVLEHIFNENFNLFLNNLNADTDIVGTTEIFIYPGFKFKCIDGLITNFHLPESTLMLLVSAFAGRKNILNAYKFAIDHEMRFFSYGDAMLII